MTLILITLIAWHLVILHYTQYLLLQTSSYIFFFIGGCLIMIFLLIYIKRQFNKLSNIRRKYLAIICVSGTGAWEYHADTGYLWCSAEYFQILGYDKESFLQQHAMTIDDVWINQLHPDDRSSAVEKFKHYMTGRSNIVYENTFRLKHKDGHWVWILSRGCALAKTSGSPSIMLGTHINITDNINTQIDLVHSNHQLSKFMFTMAHHVRGPVARMLGLIHLAKRDKEFDQQWYLNAVGNEVYDLDNILKSLSGEMNAGEIVPRQ